MASLGRIDVAWNTGAGGAGLSTYYSSVVTASEISALTTYYAAVASMFPLPVTWDIPGTGDVIDDTTGILTGSWVAAGATQVAATANKPYAAGTGYYVRWGTAGIVSGRRVVGRTFMCPLTWDGYDSSGTIASAVQTAAAAAAAVLLTGGLFRIWHRPGNVSGAPGSSHAITSSTVPDKVTSLRTRRS